MEQNRSKREQKRLSFFGEMKSDNREIKFRAFGQRSIVPSSSSSPSSGRAKGSNGGSRVSLSDFLNRKLQTTSLPAGTVQRKLTPFSMLAEPRDRPVPNDPQGGDTNGVQEEKKKKDIDKVIFQQFKLTDKEKEDCAASNGLEEGGSLRVEEEVQESRKRRNPFQGENISGKHVVVLGKDPERKPSRRKGSLTTDNKPRREYNHYENGGGFWDESMLGIDNEEVGCNEAWEGVGSTTLGGIEWH